MPMNICKFRNVTNIFPTLKNECFFKISTQSCIKTIVGEVYLNAVAGKWEEFKLIVNCLAVKMALYSLGDDCFL